MSEWEVYRLNADRQRVAQIDGFTRAELACRFNAVGSWRLDLPASAEAGLAKGSAVEFVRDGITVLSGPVTGYRRELRDDRVEAEWRGVDWLVWLHRRVIYPSASPFTAAAYDLQTGVAAETIIHHYVKGQLGSTATSDRRIAGLTFATDNGAGASLSTAGRFQNLLVEMAKTARVGGDLGFRLVKSGTDLQFGVYEPTDRSASVVFARELGNLTAYTHTVRAPTTTYAITGGAGTGTGRTFSEGGSDTSTWGRIETFVNQTSESDSDVLDAARDDTLDTGAEQTGLRLEVADEGPSTFGVDYDLGDTVTVIAADTTVVDIVREVVVVLDRNGETTTPKVRTPGERDPSDPAIYARLTDAERRLLNLEAT